MKEHVWWDEYEGQFFIADERKTGWTLAFQIMGANWFHYLGEL